MQTIFDQINEWIKDFLIGCITGNLGGLFDEVNTRVGEIAGQVGQTPSGFNGGVSSMIQNISETVMIPIAGMILTFVCCYELIQMIIEKNNMHDVDTFMFFKWIFKTTVAVYFVTHTFTIVMAVFDVSQHVIQQSAGVISGSANIDVAGALGDMQTTLEAMEIPELFGLTMETLIIGLTMKALSLCIFHHRVRAYAGNLLNDLVRPYPDGDHGKPGMGAAGPELSEIPVCAGLPRLLNHGVRRHLRGASADHFHKQRGHSRCDMGLRRLHAAALFRPVQNREPCKICIQRPLRGRLSWAALFLWAERS